MEMLIQYPAWVISQQVSQIGKGDGKKVSRLSIRGMIVMMTIKSISLETKSSTENKS